MIKSVLLRKTILFFLSSDSKGILNSLIFKYYNGKIGAGPFAGMQYINKAHGSSLTPKLIGTYERELHPFIKDIASKQYERIIDVGAAEGYYAVGLAYLNKKKKNKDFKVLAYDTNEKALDTLGKLAKLNGVEENIEIKSLCTHEELNSFDDKKTFMICDIEGGEAQLLDPSRAKVLSKMDMLVELHDGKGTNITDLLKERFKDTHTMEVIPFSGRDIQEAPWWLLSPKLRFTAIDETRKMGLKWMYMQVKNKEQ